MLTVNVYFDWYYDLRHSSDLSPSREAVDDRFQHTLDVLTVIMMTQLNAEAQALSIDVLNGISTRKIDLLSFIWDRYSNFAFLPTRAFLLTDMNWGLRYSCFSCLICILQQRLLTDQNSPNNSSETLQMNTWMCFVFVQVIKLSVVSNDLYHLF